MTTSKRKDGMTDEERQMVYNMQGFLAQAVKKGLPFSFVMATLSHEVGAWLKRLEGYECSGSQIAGYAQYVGKDWQTCPECKELHRSEEMIPTRFGESFCLPCFERTRELTVVRCADGRLLKAGVCDDAADGEGLFVALDDREGRQLAYWTSSDWCERPVEIMMQIVDALRGKPLSTTASDQED